MGEFGPARCADNRCLKAEGVVEAELGEIGDFVHRQERGCGRTVGGNGCYHKSYPPQSSKARTTSANVWQINAIRSSQHDALDVSVSIYQEPNLLVQLA